MNWVSTDNSGMSVVLAKTMRESSSLVLVVVLLIVLLLPPHHNNIVAAACSSKSYSASQNNVTYGCVGLHCQVGDHDDVQPQPNLLMDPHGLSGMAATSTALNTLKPNQHAPSYDIVISTTEVTANIENHGDSGVFVHHLLQCLSHLNICKYYIVYSALV
ncbi:hypothetical protein RJT34_18407 [Clitoria ternatea]|uniref:Uncharacterized protein n=1 Tax=Clitoria ternatea TaxID=43366 RepID=A0AAN9JAZ9_CLITE